MAVFNQVFVSSPCGKMQGIPAITTSMAENPVCKARSQNKDSICAHCYARKGLAMYKNARERYTENTKMLSSHDLESYETPVINNIIARFETHGDLVNVTHAKNYLRICYANPWCTFSIWTKNPAFMDKAIQEMGKPSNLICILSSEKVNAVHNNYKKWKWVDKVFTVYDKNFINENGIDINCGAKSCVTCRKCYTKTDSDFFIREVLK